MISPAIMELKGSVAALATKIDRLIEDIGKLSEKSDTVRNQISFVRGAIWVIGGLMAIAIAGTALYVWLK